MEDKYIIFRLNLDIQLLSQFRMIRNISHMPLMLTKVLNCVLSIFQIQISKREHLLLELSLRNVIKKRSWNYPLMNIISLLFPVEANQTHLLRLGHFKEMNLPLLTLPIISIIWPDSHNYANSSLSPHGLLIWRQSLS